MYSLTLLTKGGVPSYNRHHVHGETLYELIPAHFNEARKVVLSFMLHLRGRIKNYKDVQGTITYKLAVAARGTVESVTVLTDNMITPVSGYGRSDAVATVKSIIQQTMTRLKFPAASGGSVVIVPALVPLPDLHRIEITVPARLIP